MRLYRLLYVSENHLDHGPDALLRQLNGILEQSKVRNRSNGVTGALAFDQLWFVQTLEGDRDSVWATFSRILQDPRHDKVTLVSAGDVSCRLFGAWEWEMARIVRDASTAKIFERYSPEGRFLPRAMSAVDLVSMLREAAEVSRLDPLSAVA